MCFSAGSGRTEKLGRGREAPPYPHQESHQAYGTECLNRKRYPSLGLYDTRVTPASDFLECSRRCGIGDLNRHSMDSKLWLDGDFLDTAAKTSGNALDKFSGGFFAETR